MTQSLLQYNTFHINAHTNTLAIIDENTDLTQLLDQYRTLPILVLGGGSNMLFVKDRDGLTIINRIKHRSIIDEDDSTITLHLGAGEDRHEIVMWTVAQGRRGIENLALIPGSAGAAPIQNIGAYGTEVSNVITHVHYYDIPSHTHHTISHAQCNFGYRDSIFKQSLKDIIITAIDIQLSKSAQPIITYAGLDHLASIPHLTAQQIADTVIAIRSSKLPDWNQVGTAGSFFKNPIVDSDTQQHILTLYPLCPTWPVSKTHYKLAAGRILDHVLGLRGAKSDNNKVGCRESQALVLVNYEDASGQQVRNWAQYIISKCQNEVGITLEPEVNIVV